MPGQSAQPPPVPLKPRTIRLQHTDHSGRHYSMMGHRVTMRLATNIWSATCPRHLLAAVAARQAGRGERAGAATAGLLLLALAAFGCSTPSDDGAGPAVAERASTTDEAPPITTARPDPPPNTQPATADQLDPALTAEPDPASTAEQPYPASTAEQPEPEPTAEQPEPASTTAQPAPITSPPPTTAPPTTTQPEPSPTTTQPAVTTEAVSGQDEPERDDDEDDPRAFGESTQETGSEGTSANEPGESDGSDSENAFEPVNLATFPELARQRLFPWGDGFLHLGYLPSSTSEESCGSGQLRTRFSSDGMEWTEFSDLEVPSVHTKPTLLSQLGFDDLDCWVNTYRSAMRHLSGRRAPRDRLTMADLPGHVVGKKRQ